MNTVIPFSTSPSIPLNMFSKTTFIHVISPENLFLDIFIGQIDMVD